MRGWRLVLSVLALGLTSCVRPTPEPPPSTLYFEVYGVNDTKLPNADINIANVQKVVANADGNAAVVVPDRVMKRVAAAQVAAWAPGYLLLVQDAVPLVANKHYQLRLQPVPPPEPLDVNPMRFSLEELAAIRAAMWTVPGPWPYGPRPNQPNNLTALQFLHSYGDPRDPKHLTDTQERLLAHYKSYGFTHAFYGPPNAQSYHGLWPDHDFTTSPQEFKIWLDWLQVFWNNGLMPVVMGPHEDGATFEQTKAKYEPLIRANLEQARRVIRIVVPAGWEPARYEWSSCTWALYFDWIHELLPDALVGVHTVTDVDAPTGDDALCRDTGRGHDKIWGFLAPKLHFWLYQSAAFENPTAHGDPNHPERTNYENWLLLWNPEAGRDSLVGRFVHGTAGWPTSSLWGPGKRMRVINAEFCSYSVTRDPRRTYAECAAWTDQMMKTWTDGYGDGGSVPVPVKR